MNNQVDEFFKFDAGEENLKITESTVEEIIKEVIIFLKKYEKSISYIGVIKTDNTIELLQYKGIYGSSIKIPRTINGRTVTSIATDCFKTSSSYSNLSFYIPNTVTMIEEKAFNLYQNSYYYAYIYLEASNIPSTFETNWYYNSRYNNTSYITVTTGQNLDY